jgi:D-alanyl-D-alanine carboxypeptidase (penicillin-binding protein 5/6)
VRDIVRREQAEIAGGRTLHTWNDLLATFPAVIGVKTGHTGAAGWSEVAAARGPGVTIYATLLGGPSRGQRNDDLEELLSWGLSRYRVVKAVDGDRVYGRAPTGYDRPAVALVAPKTRLRVVRVDRPVTERVTAPTEIALPVEKGQRLGEVRAFQAGKLVAVSPLVADRTLTEPNLAGKIRWYAGRTVHHFWEAVTP